MLDNILGQRMLENMLPFTCQEMVVKNIYNYTRIAPETLFQMHFALADNGMGIGKTVNFRWRIMPFLTRSGIFFIVPALDIIANKISYLYLIRIAG
jgi:hypothetical protein